jgi:hypothetical protein
MIRSRQIAPRSELRAGAGLAGAALVLAACSFDWDALDPRAGTAAGANGGAAGSAVGGFSGSEATGGQPAAGQAGGGAAGTAGFAGGTSGPCASGLHLCDGECVSTQTNLEHCGECSNVCPRYAICMEGSCANACNAAGLEALVVVADAAALAAGDRVVTHLLGALGFTVSTVSSTDITANAAQADLVLISSTAQSNAVGTTFTEVDVPVICWDSYLYDDLELTGPDAETDYSTMIEQRRIEIADPSHPLAIGLSGVIETFNQGSDVAWGVPAGDGTVIATAAGNPQFAVLFTFEAGDALASGDPAPARRMGMFLGDASAAALSQTGERIALTSFCWAVGAFP